MHWAWPPWPPHKHRSLGVPGKRGELVWGKLDPAYQACSKGHEQSPIDIRGARLNKALQPIEFHYIAGPVTLDNDGHTIEAHVNPGSYIVAGGVRYDLVQFDFHHPGEEAVKGKLTDMEMHLVHRAPTASWPSLRCGWARTGQSECRAGRAVGASAQDAGATEKITDMVNAGGLLPADRGYWTYTGSLTTPPCTEGVRWFVFERS